MGDKRVIITGATGMVGGCALRICLESPDVSKVTVIGRSRTGINDNRLRKVVVADFTDYMVHAGLYGTDENANPILENKIIRSMKDKSK